MTIRFNDASIRTAYTRLQSTQGPVSDGDLHELLSGAADASGKSASKALTQLNQPGLSWAARAELVKGGLTASEKADLTAVLDHGGLTLTPTARALLEAVIGRDGFTPTPGPGPGPDAPVNPNGPRVSPTASSDWFGAATVSDTGLKAKLDALATTARQTPGLQVDDAAVLNLLSEIADRDGVSADAARARFDGLGRNGKLNEIRAGLTDGERGDLRALLASTTPLTPTAQLLVRDALGEPRTVADALRVAAGHSASLSSGDKLAFTADGKVAINDAAPIDISADGSFQWDQGFGRVATGQVSADGSVALTQSGKTVAGFLPGAVGPVDTAVASAIASRVGHAYTGTVLGGGMSTIELVSPDLVRLHSPGGARTARVNPDGSFVFDTQWKLFGKPETDGSLTGRFDANGTLTLSKAALFGQTNLAPQKLTLRPAVDVGVPPDTEALIQYLRSREGSTASLTQPRVSVRLGEGPVAEITALGETVPVRISPDGNFSLEIMGHNSRTISGRFTPAGEVIFDRVFVGLGASVNAPTPAPLVGTQKPVRPLNPTERLLAVTPGKTVYDEAKVGSGLSVNVVAPNRLGVLDTNHYQLVTVNERGHFSYNKRDGSTVSGIVTTRGEVFFSSGSRVSLPSNRIGPFAPSWREEDLVGAYSDPGSFVPMTPGSRASAAQAAVIELERRAMYQLKTAGLASSAFFDPYQYQSISTSQLEAGRNEWKQLVARRSSLTPEQRAIVDAAQAALTRLREGTAGLGGGRMPSKALTWLEANSTYVRGLPVALNDVAGQLALERVRTTMLGGKAEGVGIHGRPYEVELLSPTRIRIKTKSEEFVANVGPDGAFGYSTAGGATVTGHLSTEGQVVLTHKSVGDAETFRGPLKGGGTTPVPERPSVSNLPPMAAPTIREQLAPLVGSRVTVPFTPPLQLDFEREDKLTGFGAHGRVYLSIDAQGRVSGKLPDTSHTHPDGRVYTRTGASISGRLAADGTLTLTSPETTTVRLTQRP